ncbi:erythromycin esterase family protein [Psychroserpens sp. NJDZ02]|uniref:erythromycin esterase family protein n=1 Tax=Psychroserpens sp. NJDZ02 TaxID=2570561 RepID=UPI0010A7E34F|nr:erythromycin esterase family protein [Psychroserpens sp. NJDZ02]QCE40220.1 erythromycin esterase family protein [Psychroserpens sp. NJDZ02]
MKNIILIIFTVFGLNSIFAQIEQNIYELNSMENLLTEDIKDILDINLIDKKVIFLGEAEHHIGSDFLAKTEFVKYLVLEKGYKDIAFEGDFFGLYFDHNKINLYSFWSRSVQCNELFEFLKEHNVTIWGFDNQMGSGYTWNNFTNKLTEFLQNNSISFDKKFTETTENYIKNRKKATKVIGKSNLEYLITEVDKLIKNETVIKDKLWSQFLKSYRSDIIINSTHKSNKKGIPVRDSQMAKNLDFLVKSMPEKKFIVWLANAHMTKYEYDFMKGQTMGGQFVNMNPNISYHIAISSIHMPYRKEKWIEKSSKDSENLLHYLPSTEKNYFIDSKQIINKNPEYSEKIFEGMFNLEENKTNWFKHFDALVFISKGEKVKYPK